MWIIWILLVVLLVAGASGLWRLFCQNIDRMYGYGPDDDDDDPPLGIG